MKNILVTGGCGFIGSCFVKKQIAKGNFVLNIDKLTYAGNLENVQDVASSPNYRFTKADINETSLIGNLLQSHKIDWVVNFAAESHVDNSISGPGIFVQTNINGTYSLLQASLNYYKSLSDDKKNNFRFLHVSTDEVFGTLHENDQPFNENSRYQPNSPYSASKASSDHLVRAWHETFKLPTIITNCSNNFGPYQHREKLIPTVIRSCLENKDIPIYGNGKNIRDWIYVGDHCDGIELALSAGKVNETYLFGGEKELRNIEIADKICEILDNIKPKNSGESYKSQIKFVQDRAGHDFRYAISNEKSFRELGFKPSKTFEQRLEETIKFYIGQK
ncbi:MAG: dTDP-glucose 4,6-dehydratase [Proteobacteria bacterium]|nr:dTDP-glucose 4,6-dehydratase [Pseudomonadota bacterium]NCA28782.1 dTDP-glucose 4,6-dehydratase [Pseudomonadota bacterium]